MNGAARRDTLPVTVAVPLGVAHAPPVRAQEVISGSRLKGNSVTGAKIRDGSLAAKDFSSRARRTLKTPASRSARPRWPTAHCGAATWVATRVTCSWTSGPIGPGACQTLPVGLSQAAEDAIALVTAPANWPAPIQVTGVLGPGDRSISVLACNFTGAAADPGPVSFRYLVIEFS